ncbi:cardiolipin synthase [Mangrovimonas spongiae]|uniref:Cardiolipin synthase n=1 Tax=Mangrovimonas spongiae TaxID=2494697 RepID=A0A3R9NWS8_9FLAO|nr:cardiolipin synthase [Mangrovimonas spongiae]RSK39329.1 cardiolipin synthase [Mangrovimonas spongiae]
MEFLKDNFWNILIVLNYVLAISAAITILFKNINPSKTLTYIIVLVFFPFFGLVVYYFFGQEYRKNKIFNRKRILNKSVVKRVQEELELNTRELEEVKKQLDKKVKLVKLLHNSDNSPLTLNNNVELLFNGEAKFKRLLKDLDGAKHHIHLEYYIIKDDRIGTQVIDILCEKAKSGVKVRVSYDDVGSKISKKSKHKLKQSGVEFFPFMPVLFPRFAGKMNYRNHRKIAIVDGEIGYVGGINMSDTYMNYTDSKLYWRDTHVRIVGEAVKQLQIHFLTTWDFVSGETINITTSYFPEIHYNDDVAVQIAGSGPDTDWANILEVLMLAITTAEDYVYITTPYFIPNDEIVTALQIADKSGVDVKLIVPYESDSWTAKHATNSFLQPLLEAGVEVYHYTKGFVHAKTVVIDDIFCTVGTSNMDYRSFNINFEVNAIIYNEQVSVDLKKQFLKDLQDCNKIDINVWEKRSNFIRLQESLCRLWSPLL